MFYILLIFSFVFNSRYFTNFQNAFSYTVIGDTFYVSTGGGVVRFSADGIQLQDSSFSLDYRVFTASDGLKSNTVIDLDFDNSGNLWVIVKDIGIQLMEKDSERFRAYNVPVVTLRKSKKLKFYSDRYLLIGTDFGLFVVDTKGNTDENDDRVYPPLLVRDTVLYIQKGNEIAYVVTPGRIYGWTPDSIYPIDVPVFEGRFGPIIETRSGFVYSTGNRLVQVEGDTVFTYSVSDVLNFSSFGDSIFISKKGGLYLLHQRRLERLFSFSSALSIPTPRGVISTFYAYNRDFTYYAPHWLLYNDGKLYKFRGPIPFNLISTLKEKNGTVVAGILNWIYDTLSLPSKLYILRGDSVYLCRIINTGGKAVSSVDVDDSGNIWVGFWHEREGGIYILDPHGNLKDSITTIFPSKVICHLDVGEDTVVALWFKGIYRIRKFDYGYVCEEIFKVDYPYSIARTSEGAYLVATENEGLLKIDKSGNVLLRLYPYDLNSSLVTCAKERDGRVYIGTPNGLLIYQNSRISKVFEGNIRDIEFYRQYTLALADSALLVLQNDKVFDILTMENSPITGISEPYYYVRPVLEVSSDGEIFAGGEQGLLRMKVLYPSLAGKSIRVFPNPCNKGDVVYIESTDSPVIYDLAFFPVNVKVEKVGDLYLIDTHNLERGLYIIVSGNKQAKLLVR